MKSPSLLIAAAMISPAFALTPDEITPAALVGKTITFTATSGTGLLPASGTWTGRCEVSPATEFSIENTGSGIVQDHQTSFTAVNSSGTTTLSLGSAYANSGNGTLNLGIASGQGIYALACVRVNLVNGLPSVTTATQGGTFTLEAPVVKLPEITVKEGTSNLADGSAKTNFGNVKVGKKSGAKTYKITNTGTANLSGIKVVTTGPDKSSFIPGKPGATSLAPGASTTFNMVFKPAKKGLKNAAIQIASTDADENPFDIRISGVGKK